MSAGLAASTVTPGSTAPDVSLTAPAIPPDDCACACPTNIMQTSIIAHTSVVRFLDIRILHDPVTAITCLHLRPVHGELLNS